MKGQNRKSLLAALLLALAAGPVYADPMALHQEQEFRAQLMRDLRDNVEALYRESLKAARESTARTFAAAVPSERREANELKAPGRDRRRAVADEFAL